MPKPSLYSQIEATQVTGNHLIPSPRHWNCGLLRYKGRLWLCYRYHLGAHHGSRCATAMVPIDRETFQPTQPSQHLNLRSVIGDEHFEDARLFMFKGEVYISYTKMTGYQPGKDYNCSVEYAKLKLKGSTWHVEETWHPQFGQNSGFGKEKNWIFFEQAGALWCIYQDHPSRKVLRVEGDKVMEVVESAAPVWQWGQIRGGTPPVPYGDGSRMLAVFHSSLQTEDAPHFRRYYGAAYLFEAKPPFRVTAITAKPLMSGSEQDGHGFDPRYSHGWKPFIPFPCGLVTEGENWLVSLGVNDWQCAVGRLRPEQLQWMAPDGSGRPMRYFRTDNGSKPIRIVGADQAVLFVNWDVPRPDGRGARAPSGYKATDDGRLCEMIEEQVGVEEITAEQYRAAMVRSGKSLMFVGQ